MHWVVLSSVDLTRPSAYVLHLRGWVMGLLHADHRVTLIIPTIQKTDTFYNLFKHEKLEVIFYSNPFKFSFLGTIMAIPVIDRLSKNKNIILYSRFNLLSFIILKYFNKIPTITEHNGIVADELKFLLPICKNFLYKWGALLQRMDAKYATKIRAVTPQIKEYLVKNGIDASKILVISNGSDTELFQPKSRLKSLEHFGLDPNRFYVGFIGSITKWQAVDDLIHAFIKIKDLPIDLLIAGDGSEVPFLKKLCASLSHRIHFLGKIDILDAPTAINCFDIAIATMRRSLYTSSGSGKIKIRDYAACGRVILTGDTIEHENLEKNGVLKTYSMDNVEDLAHQIQCLYHDENKRRTISQKSYDYAQKHFSWNFLVKNMLSRLNIS